MSQARFGLGDRVRDQYGAVGEVTAIFARFAVVPHLSVDPDEWLAAQEIPFTLAELDEPWYSVACDDGGAINSCESKLEAVP